MVRDLVAELVMGRVCYGPSLSWAEFVMGRDVPESSEGALYIGLLWCVPFYSTNQAEMTSDP